MNEQTPRVGATTGVRAPRGTPAGGQFQRRARREPDVFALPGPAATLVGDLVPGDTFVGHDEHGRRVQCEVLSPPTLLPRRYGVAQVQLDIVRLDSGQPLRVRYGCADQVHLTAHLATTQETSP